MKDGDGYGAKKLSGAEYRKLRKQRRQEEKKASGSATDVAASVNAFTALGSAPIDDPTTAMEWVRRCQLVALEQVLRDPETTAKEKFRAVKEMSEAIGKTQSRHAIEAEVKELREAVAMVKAKAGAVKLEPGHAVPRPATARGSRGRNRPRAIPGPLPSAETGEGEGNPPDGGGQVG